MHWDILFGKTIVWAASSAKCSTKGQGGMGTTVRRHKKAGKSAAEINRIWNEKYADPEYYARITREPRSNLASSLHPAASYNITSRRRAANANQTRFKD